MLISELQVDDVEPWLCWLVRDVKGSVLVVLTFDFCLAWAFYRQGEASIAGILGVDSKCVVLKQFFAFTINQAQMAIEYILPTVADVINKFVTSVSNIL